MPLLGVALVVVAVQILLPESVGAAAAFAASFGWVLVAALWIANGKSLLSVAIWAIPAAALSLAWLLWSPAVWYGVAAVNLGLLLISFVPRAADWWDVQVSRIGTRLARLSMRPDERDIDVAAERVRLRIWTAAQAAKRSGRDEFLAELARIRNDAEVLSSRPGSAADLRDALSRLIDGVHDPQLSADTPASHEASRALADYWAALHAHRSRSTLYRIMSWKRE